MEITLAAIISPMAALGYVSGGGMAEVWWREVVILSTAQAVQMLLLYLAAAILVSPAQWGSEQMGLGPFLFVAALWLPGGRRTSCAITPTPRVWVAA